MKLGVKYTHIHKPSYIYFIYVDGHVRARVYIFTLVYIHIYVHLQWGGWI